MTESVIVDTRTIQVLKNFSTINKSIVVRPGNTIDTISSGKSIVARAELDVSFDTDFAIGDLSRFLGVLSLFEAPELRFGEKSVSVVGGGKRVNYAYADPSTVLKAPSNIKVPPFEVEFQMTHGALSDAMKGLGVLGFSDLAVVGDGKNISLRAFSDRLQDTYDVVVGETGHTFQMVFKAENLKLLPETYAFKISSKGLAHLTANRLEYWIAVEADKSTFSG